jgi:hypothetical protein
MTTLFVALALLAQAPNNIHIVIYTNDDKASRDPEMTSEFYTTPEIYPQLCLGRDVQSTIRPSVPCIGAGSL